MDARIHVFPDLGDMTFGVHQECDSGRGAEGARYAIGLLYSTVFIGDQGEGEGMFRAELAVTRLVVAGDAENGDPRVYVLFEAVAKRTSLFGAAGRAVFGVEVHNGRLAPHGR